jgi:hypothetical protein
MRTRLIAPLAALVTAIAAMTIGAPGAQSASYRYWSYWLTTEGSWTFSNRGPAFYVPADGTVEGWRFGISEGTTGAGLYPRATPDFDRICAETPEQSDRKRIALVVDPGTTAHAPEGETPGEPWAMCVSVGLRATGFDVLRAATTVRTQRGLVCALTDYPAQECAVALRQPVPEPTASPKPPTQAPTPTPRPGSTGPSPQPQPAKSPTRTPSAPNPVAPTAESDSNPPSASPTEEETEEVTLTAPSTAPQSPTSVPLTPSADAASTPEITIASAPVMPAHEGPSAWLGVIAAVGIAVLAFGAWLRARGRRL